MKPKPTTTAQPGRCYGYARVSTVQQAEDGESLDVQQRQIVGYSLIHSLEIANLYVERGVSGSKPLADRPQGAALLAVLRPGDMVITPKLDRMFRSALDALEVLHRFQKVGIGLHMIDLGGDVVGNGMSKLVFTILSAVAEAERDRTRERITEVKRDQRLRGRYLGGIAPFGWKAGEGGVLVPVPEQQVALRQMQRMRGQGKSLRDISQALTRRGMRVSHVGVRRALLACAEAQAAG
jgi:putative DNA-invertase from lambdoid prophage Rac